MNIHCNRDYSKCKIYKLVGEGGSVYIGHTTETLETRESQHKHPSNKCVSNTMVNLKIEILEDYPCADLLNARMREQFYMDQYPDRINIENAYTDKKEYKREYDQKRKEDGTRYYDKNKEYCLAKGREYVLKNAEKTKIYKAGWKKANPNSSRPKKECPHCHLLFNPGNISRHKKGCASTIPSV